MVLLNKKPRPSRGNSECGRKIRTRGSAVNPPASGKSANDLNDFRRIRSRVSGPAPGSGFMITIYRRRLLAQATTIMAGIGLGPLPSAAQTSPFPARPIRILVGFAAGGGNDVITRILAQKLSEGPLGPVLVDNRTGASGLIAADILAKAIPDGTTLMVAAQTTYA